MPLTAEQIKKRLRGVAVGLLTPFDDEGEIDYRKLGANAEALGNSDIETFLATANISEYHSLSHQERIASARTAVDALPYDACVLAGVGGSTAEATDLVEAYARIDVDAMMVMPPDHTYVHEQGMIEYLEKLDAASDRPLVPYVKGFDPSIQYLADVTHIDGVVGVKYALEDAVKLGEGVAAGADDVVWVNGLAEPYAVSFWNEGIEGFSAGVSNFRPEVGLALFDALSNENWERARQLRNICMPFQKLREGTGENNTIESAISVPVVKKGLDLAGLHGGSVREPIRPLSTADEREAKARYDQLDDDIDQLV